MFSGNGLQQFRQTCYLLSLSARKLPYSGLGAGNGGNSGAFFGFARPFLNHLRPHDRGYGDHHKAERAAATGVVVPGSRIIQATEIEGVENQGREEERVVILEGEERGGELLDCG
ncbi:hypothetical protein NL676_036694 [Syzygium grande]|nr:hypothetical protein NL676_036694 [Syzygium grande]